MNYERRNKHMTLDDRIEIQEATSKNLPQIGEHEKKVLKYLKRREIRKISFGICIQFAFFEGLNPQKGAVTPLQALFCKKIRT